MKKIILTVLLSFPIVANICYGFDTRTIDQIPFNQTFNTATDITVKYNIPTGKSMTCDIENAHDRTTYLKYKDLKQDLLGRYRNGTYYQVYEQLLILPPNSIAINQPKHSTGSVILSTNNQDQFFVHIEPLTTSISSETASFSCKYQ